MVLCTSNRITPCPQAELCDACENGDIDLVRELLGRGVSPDAKDEFGWPAVVSAAAGGHTAVVLELLGRGVSPDTTNNAGDPAVVLAAAGGHTEVVRELISRGADVNAYHDETALMAAVEHAHMDVFKLLLESKADPDMTGSKEFMGVTPLDLALDAHRGCAHPGDDRPREMRQQTFGAEMAHMLIDAGAKTDAYLERAVEENDEGAARRLKEAGAVVPGPTVVRETMERVIRFGVLEEMRVLRAAGAEVPPEPEVVELVLQRAADSGNMGAAKGLKRLGVAVPGAVTEKTLKRAVDSGALEALRVLKAAGAAVPSEDVVVRVALEQAISSGNRSAVLRLKAAGAAVPGDAVALAEQNQLQRAIDSGNTEAVWMLKRMGAAVPEDAVEQAERNRYAKGAFEVEALIGTGNVLAVQRLKLLGAAVPEDAVTRAEQRKAELETQSRSLAGMPPPTQTPPSAVHDLVEVQRQLSDISVGATDGNAEGEDARRKGVQVEEAVQETEGETQWRLPRLHQLQWRLQPPDGCGDVCGSAVKGKAAVSEEVYRAAVAAEQLIVMTAEAWEAFDRGLGSTLYSVHGEGKKARGRSSGSKLPPVDWHKSDYRADLLVQKGFKKVAADKPAIVVVEQPVAEGATWFEVKFVYSPGAASEVEGEARNAMLALSHSRFKEAEGGTATRQAPRDPLGESAEITERGSKTFVRRSLSTVAPPLFLFLLLPAPPSLTDPAPHTHSCNSTFFSPTHSFPPSLFSGGADAQLGRSRSTCAGREGEGAWSCTQVGRPVWTWWEERPEAPRGDQPRKPSRAGSGEPRA